MPIGSASISAAQAAYFHQVLSAIDLSSSLAFRFCRFPASPWFLAGRSRLHPRVFSTRSLNDIYRKRRLHLPGNTKRVIYFPGCSAALSRTAIGEAVIKVLLHNGADVILPELGCCGMPAYMSGDFKTAERLAFRNINTLRELKADALVVSCGSCGFMMKSIYASHLNQEAVPFEVLDISEYLSPGKLKTGSSLNNLKLTYHDPCHLRRGLKVTVPPRELLKSLPGVDFIEMAESDACCGSGGSFSLKYYDLSKSIRRRKLNFFLRTRADVLATGCPACIFHLEDGFTQRNIKTPVLHPVEILSRTYPNIK